MAREFICRLKNLVMLTKEVSERLARITGSRIVMVPQILRYALDDKADNTGL
jgi:hypothetical protein